MRVERDTDRQRGTDSGPQALQQFTLAVLAEVGHHGAVQSQQYAVQLSLMGQRGGNDGCRHGVECGACDRSAGLRMGAQDMHHVPAVGAARIQETG